MAIKNKTIKTRFAKKTLAALLILLIIGMLMSSGCLVSTTCNFDSGTMKWKCTQHWLFSRPSEYETDFCDVRIYNMICYSDAYAPAPKKDPVSAQEQKSSSDSSQTKEDSPMKSKIDYASGETPRGGGNPGCPSC